MTEHVTGTASNVVDIEEDDLDDPVPEEEDEVVDEVGDINDDGREPAIHHRLYGEDEESRGAPTAPRWYHRYDMEDSCTDNSV